MLVLSQGKFDDLVEKNERVLANAYVYTLSSKLQLKDGDGENIGDNKLLLTLVPSDELVKSLISGDISKRQFKKDYKKSLKSYQNQFLLYMIARSFNEKKYLPIFVTSEEEAELGFTKIFAAVLKDKFGMKQIKPKEYMKAVKDASKEAKKAKKKKRAKVLERFLKDVIKDNLQMSLDGLEELKKLEQKFAIDRVAILINQSNDPMEEISKKDVAKALDLFAQGGKKAKKLVKEAVKELGLSKKPDRWGKKDIIKLVLAIYDEIHSDDDEEDTRSNRRK
jgi:hypothetical protein